MAFIQILGVPTIYTAGNAELCNITYNGGHLWRRYTGTVFQNNFRTDCALRSCIHYRKSTGIFYWRPEGTTRSFDVSVRRHSGEVVLNNPHSEFSTKLWDVSNTSSAYANVADCFVLDDKEIPEDDRISLLDMLRPQNLAYRTLLNSPAMLQILMFARNKNGFTEEQRRILETHSYYSTPNYMRQLFDQMVVSSLFNLAFYFENTKKPNMFWQAEIDGALEQPQDPSANYYDIRGWASNLTITSGNKTKPTQIKEADKPHTTRARAASSLRTMVNAKLRTTLHTPVAITELRRQFRLPYERLLNSLPESTRAIIRS